MSEIACVDIVTETVVLDRVAPVEGIVPGSHFAHFLETVNRADDKVGLIDRFLAEQETFPVIEGDSLVHFVYWGEANDVALTGDLVGRRFDQPMHRVDGTDLFTYSSYLAPDARITYRSTLSLQEAAPDPLNSRSIRTPFLGRL